MEALEGWKEQHWREVGLVGVLTVGWARSSEKLGLITRPIWEVRVSGLSLSVGGRGKNCRLHCGQIAAPMQQPIRCRNLWDSREICWKTENSNAVLMKMMASTVLSEKLLCSNLLCWKPALPNHIRKLESWLRNISINMLVVSLGLRNVKTSRLKRTKGRRQALWNAHFF